MSGSSNSAALSASTAGQQRQTPALEVREVGIEFASRSAQTYTAVSGVSLAVRNGEFVAIVGPTGCGKSTLLNALAGLLEPTEGSIEVFGKPLRGINTWATYLFQKEQLLPWLNARQNIELGFTFQKKLSKPERQATVGRWLDQIGLTSFADRYPAQMSGGMRKRVAIAQTWVSEPNIILMDEPFSALDVHTRQRIETNLLEIWDQQRNTVVFVTHDLEEAIALADRVVLLGAGPASNVVGEYAIDLPRPRDLLNIRTTSAFLEYHRTIWAALREEVIKSYERDQS
jgi:NitT/TauT family transport system ATP-binding protein